MKKLGFIILLAAGINSCNPSAEEGTNNELYIIPQPREIRIQGKAFEIDPHTTIRADEDLMILAGQLKAYLSSATGISLEINKRRHGGKQIELKIDKEIAAMGDEAYIISSSSRKVQIKAAKGTGIFYGIQTLRQLVPPRMEETSVTERSNIVRIPQLSVVDGPRFSWRGLMLDCSRTFWDKEYIKKTIRLLAYYKMNVLHLHLSDDQGWRLQIDQYPELTQKGAQFPEKWNEPRERQGFYSKDDIREIIAYAELHHVTVVPEIEMPGHSLAVLACYPDLSCTGGPFEIHPFFKGPGIHEDILCAGNDKTFVFLENVLGEVFELFPSGYIHIGGDEAPKARWEVCEKCQSRIAEEGLKDEHELQSWFIKRMEEYIKRSGKKLIGWDEILEGGISPTATVMYWRGWLDNVPGEIISKGNHIIMSPTTHCYFDYDYKTISTLKAYEFEPVPPGLSAEQSKKVLGIQANFWSHIDRTETGVDRQLYPRLLSISEVGWIPESNKDTARFKEKVQNHLLRLEHFQVSYNSRW